MNSQYVILARCPPNSQRNTSFAAARRWRRVSGKSHDIFMQNMFVLRLISLILFPGKRGKFRYYIHINVGGFYRCFDSYVNCPADSTGSTRMLGSDYAGKRGAAYGSPQGLALFKFASWFFQGEQKAGL